MRNFIRTRLLDVIPGIRSTIEVRLQGKLAYAEKHSINSIRGQVTGEGDVKNTFVLGKVSVAKNAMIINSIVDNHVELIIEEGARVVDCSFHGYAHDKVVEDVKIIIGKNSTMFQVWTAEGVTIGDDCYIALCQMHDTGASFRCNVTKGITIGNNSFIYGSYMCSFFNRDEGAQAGITLGDNAIIIASKLNAHDGEMVFGPDATLCNYDTALDLVLKADALRELDRLLELNNVIDMVGNIKQGCTLELSSVDLTCGRELYSGSCISFFGAFHKTGRPKIKFGDAVNIVTNVSESRDHGISINVNKCDIGNRVNIVTEGDSWYGSSCPIRCMTVGDDSTLIINASNDAFDGLDKHIPSNCIVRL